MNRLLKSQPTTPRGGSRTGECRKLADSRLLTHVSDLSGHLTENRAANRASWPMDVHLKSMLLGITSAVVLSIAAALAESHDQDAARQAVESGEILPLADILPRCEASCRERSLESRLKARRATGSHEFRVLNGKGHLYEVYVDARTGASI